MARVLSTLMLMVSLVLGPVAMAAPMAVATQGEDHCAPVGADHQVGHDLGDREDREDPAKAAVAVACPVCACVACPLVLAPLLARPALLAADLVVSPDAAPDGRAVHPALRPPLA